MQPNPTSADSRVRRPRILFVAALFLLGVPAMAATPTETEDRAIRRTDVPPQWWQAEQPQPRIGRLPFRAGERLEFMVRVLGKEAGRAVATVRSRTRRGGVPALRIDAGLRSSGVFDSIYPVNDEVTMYLDPKTATPIHSKIVMRQNRTPEVNVEYNFGGAEMGRVRGRRTAGRSIRRIDERTPVRALDPIAVFYHLRAREWEIGDRFSLFVHNGRRTYRVDVHVAREENVWTDLGLRDGFRLNARAVRADGTRPRWSQNMVFWLSTEPHRLPLRLHFDIPLGKVEVTLAAVGDGREPTAAAP
jgi:hypothetical protein